MKKKTKLLWATVLVLLLAVLFYLFLSMNRSLPTIKTINNIELNSVLTEGYSIHNDQIKVVAFMFTNCPDICPSTMVDLSELQTELKEANLFGDQVEIVTITLDPAFDTEEVLANYLDHFDADPDGWYMLRGTQAETEHAASEFQMVYQSDENGFITHGTNMYLVDGKDQIRAVHDMNVMGEPVDLESLMGNVEWLLGE